MIAQTLVNNWKKKKRERGQFSKLHCRKFLPLRLELNPEFVKFLASSSPIIFCQFGVTLASDIGHTTAVSVVRLTLAEDTCDCP